MNSASAAAGSAVTGGSSSATGSSSSTASTSSSSPSPTHAVHHGLSGGKIAGIVVGAVVGGLLLITLGVLVCCRKAFKKRKERKQLRETHEGYQPQREKKHYEPPKQENYIPRSEVLAQQAQQQRSAQPTASGLEKGEQQIHQTPTSHGNTGNAVSGTQTTEHPTVRDGNFYGAGTAGQAASGAHSGGVTNHTMQMAGNPDSVPYSSAGHAVTGAGSSHGTMPTSLKASDVAGVPSNMGRTAADVAGIGQGGTGRAGEMVQQASQAAGRYGVRNT